MIEKAYADNIDMLVCPECKSDLSFVKEKVAGKTSLREKLVCARCNTEYPIINGIPIFWNEGEKNEFSEDITTNPADSELQDKVTMANVLFHDSTCETYESDLSTEGIDTYYCQNRIQKVLEFIASQSGDKFYVDIGCGTGNVLKHGVNIFEKSVGIDVSFGMLTKAMHKGFFVAKGNAFQLPIADNTLNAISGFSFLHHLYDQTPFFFECIRVLKPGGYLYTDFDQNREAMLILERSKISVFLKNMYAMLRRISAQLYPGKKVMHHSKEFEKIVHLAEYHVYQEKGILEEDLRNRLLEAGFTKCRIIKHWNSASYEGAEYNSISLRDRFVKIGEILASFHFSSNDLSPYLLVLAQK